VPAPDWTRRPNAKDDLKQRAVALRAEGWSVPDTAQKLGVSRSTAWLWVRDQPLDKDGERARAGADRRAAGVRLSWTRRLADTDQQRQAAHQAAADRVGSLRDDDLLKIGAIMYWCEGTKAKPWAGMSERVSFTNSDPGLIRIFLRFLVALEVSRDQIRYRVAIHETADAADAVHWWAGIVGADPSQFQRTTIKRSQPATGRYNTGDAYRGCLTVSVLGSRQIYWLIEGVVLAVAGSCTAPGPSTTSFVR
jgi:transposase-like protein